MSPCDRDPDGNGAFDEGNGVTTRVSVSTAGVAGNDTSTRPVISADGNWIVFKSAASNLVADDENVADDVFIHDRLTGTTTRVSLTDAGGEANGDSSVPVTSSDGRFVAFRSIATNLVPGVGNGSEQVFLIDRQTGRVVAVSTDANGIAGNGNSSRPSISSDARLVAYYSDAPSLVAGDTNAARDIFLRDVDSDGDAVFEGSDNCPGDANVDQADGDSDGLGDVCDDDRDGDGFPNSVDGCPDDASKSDPLTCGCAAAETDTDGDGAADCIDDCSDDPDKIEPGVCGCGSADVDDGNGDVVCGDGCPSDPDKVVPGDCGCGTPDVDSDDDSVMDCIDNCVEVQNAEQLPADAERRSGRRRRPWNRRCVRQLPRPQQRGSSRRGRGGHRRPLRGRRHE